MRNHVYLLDLLRFFAAFCVLAYHLSYFGWASDWGTTGIMLNHAARFEALAPFTWFGWVGVEIFFVISGFVIANSAHGRSPIDFLKGRLLRLYPAAWICATITLVAWLVFAHRPLPDAFGEYVRSISLWINGPWIDGVYWSLAVEIVFYALVFWVLAAGRLIQLTALPWILTGLTLINLAIAATPGAAAAIGSYPILGEVMRHSETLLFVHGSFFAAGIWLWLMSRREMTPLRYAGLVVAVGCGLAEIARRTQEVTQSDLNVVMAHPVWEPLTLWVLAFSLIVVAARAPHLFEVRSPRWQARLKRIGLMTYPMFLVHNVVGAGIIRTAVGMGINQWVALAIAVIVVVGLAYVICSTVEVEVRRRLRAALDLADRYIRKALASPQGASGPR